MEIKKIAVDPETFSRLACARASSRDVITVLESAKVAAKIEFTLEKNLSPSAWTGEGLPPVGTVCEFSGFNPDETLPTDPLVGDQVTVIAHFKSGPIDLAAFTFFGPPDFEFLQLGHGAHGCFRPIRTPEQIAAEERERTIEDIREIARCAIAEGHPAAEAVYDAGYRKQVQP